MKTKAQRTDEARLAYLRVLEAELFRRRGENDDRADEARQWLNDTFDQMEERMRAAPDYVEPTEAERREGLAELQAWFRERGLQKD